jgi:DNA-binding NtrC family response regulator
MRKTNRAAPLLLVVDDEEDHCRAIKSYFSRRGFTGLAAASGEEALTTIKGCRPDLVLLDKKISGLMDGKGVLRALSQKGDTTKVIMITGYLVKPKEIREIKALGVAGFLTKPVDFEMLEQAVKRALGKRYPASLTPPPKQGSPDVWAQPDSFREIKHELANICGDINLKCELYLLDTEDGFYKDKTTEERLQAAIAVIKSVTNSAQRLKDLITRLSDLIKE